MIASFGDRATEDLYDGKSTKRTRKLLPVQLHGTARRRLDMIAAAVSLGDLKSPPGNRLESLRGDLQGHWSIRINDQYRIVFVWEDGQARDVRITDYR